MALGLFSCTPTPNLSRLTLVSGDAQAGSVRAAVPEPLRVRVADARGRGVARVPVRFFSSTLDVTVATAEDGSAQLGGLVFPESVGSASVVAELPELGQSVTFSLTSQTAAGPPVVFALTTQGGQFHADLPGLGRVTVDLPASESMAAPVLELSTTAPPGDLVTPNAVAVAVLIIRSDFRSTTGVPLLLRLPDRRVGDEITAPYWFNPRTGGLDPIEVVGADQESVTLAIPSFGWKGLGGQLQRNLFTQSILLLHATVLRDLSDAGTDFEPQHDEWPFPNAGTSVTRDGQCTGQTLSMLKHFVERQSDPSLPRLGDLTAPVISPALLHYELAQGVRFTAAVQQQYLQDRTVLDVLQDYRTWLSLPPKRWNYLLLVDALRRTRQPQLVALWKRGSGGHAVLAWAARPSAGEILVSDPSYPGVVRTLNFTDGEYESFPSQPNADDTQQLHYDNISFVPVSSLGPGFASTLALEWTAWRKDEAGAPFFTDYTLKVGPTRQPYTPGMIVYDDRIEVVAEGGPSPLALQLFTAGNTAPLGARLETTAGEETEAYAWVAEPAVGLRGPLAHVDFIDFVKFTLKHGGYDVASADGTALPAMLRFAPDQSLDFRILGADGSRPVGLDSSKISVTVTGDPRLTAQVFPAGAAFGVRLVGVTTTVSGLSVSFFYKGALMRRVDAALINNQCNSMQVAGADTPESRVIEMGARSGTFTFSYDTQSVRDRLVVSYEGVALFDTGCVGEAATRTISFAGDSSQVLVDVTPNCAGGSGTVWSFSLGCPL